VLCGENKNCVRTVLESATADGNRNCVKTVLESATAGK